MCNADGTSEPRRGKLAPPGLEKQLKNDPKIPTMHACNHEYTISSCGAASDVEPMSWIGYVQRGLSADGGKLDKNKIDNVMWHRLEAISQKHILWCPHNIIINEET